LITKIFQWILTKDLQIDRLIKRYYIKKGHFLSQKPLPKEL